MIEEFKSDLKSLTSLQVFRKYILNGECYLLNNDQHFHIREDVCENFSVEFNDVVMVGSGKLGFSLKPSKRFVEFSDDSDIDIAIVSPILFQRVWEEAYLFKKSAADWPKANAFFKYLSEGWIRPDKLPSSDYFDFSKQWWGFFNILTATEKYGPYKIRAGLYHSHFFLKEYQTICIEQCMQEIH
ncbi:hypothetical protein [Desulfuromonas thiophila]|uniref:Uncharacterized protein n=1 Tax=Desulfuromonas thiophila TaxID=57664 RepID=A0A1G7EAZ6_9BACT|nr:hypothetical protein [Desulfuromonas thiophila]SDE60616.1 hypothetical protein SAMN05661003_1194 [Desulfuromonas thiophila]